MSSLVCPNNPRHTISLESRKVQLQARAEARKHDEGLVKVGVHCPVPGCGGRVPVLLKLSKGVWSRFG